MNGIITSYCPNIDKKEYEMFAEQMVSAEKSRTRQIRQIASKSGASSGLSDTVLTPPSKQNKGNFSLVGPSEVQE